MTLSDFFKDTKETSILSLFSTKEKAALEAQIKEKNGKYHFKCGSSGSCVLRVIHNQACPAPVKGGRRGRGSLEIKFV